jgi:hypothetical protein
MDFFNSKMVGQTDLTSATTKKKGETEKSEKNSTHQIRKKRTIATVLNHQSQQKTEAEAARTASSHEREKSNITLQDIL